MQWLVAMNAWEPPEDSPFCWPTETVNAFAAMGHQVEVLAGLVPHGATVPPNVRVIAWDQRQRDGDLDWEAFYRHAGVRLRREKNRRTISFLSHVPAQLMHPWARLGEADHPQGVEDHWPWPINWWVHMRKKFPPRRPSPQTQEAQALRDPLVQKVISISPAMTAGLRQIGVRDQCLVELRPGVPRFATPARETGAARAPWLGPLDLAENALVLLWPTPGMPRRWFEAAMAALRGLLPDHPSLVVLLAGEMAYRHHHQAVDYGIRPQFRLLPTAGRLAGLVSAADFTLNLTPAPQSCSRHTLMSLAGGVPVVTHGQDGAVPLLKDEAGAAAGAIIADPENPASIRRALETMLQPQRTATMRQAARRIAPTLCIARHAEALLRAVG